MLRLAAVTQQQLTDLWIYTLGGTVVTRSLSPWRAIDPGTRGAQGVERRVYVWPVIVHLHAILRRCTHRDVAYGHDAHVPIHSIMY